MIANEYASARAFVFLQWKDARRDEMSTLENEDELNIIRIINIMLLVRLLDVREDPLCDHDGDDGDDLY